MRELRKKIRALLISLLAFSVVISSAMGAPGGLLWSVNYNPSTGPDVAYGTAVDGTGIYVVGYDSVLGATNAQWRIQKRSLTTGSLIWSKTSNPSTGSDCAYDVAVDGTGVYIVGYELSGADSKWRIEKRSLTTGSLIWSKTSNPSTGTDGAYGVAVSSTGVYIVGYDSSLGYPNTQWRIEKRSLTTGAIIWSKTINPSTGDDVAYRVAVDSTGVYIVGHSTFTYGDLQWRIEKRSLTTGSLIWSKTSNPSSRIDAAKDVAVDSTGVYIVGFDSVLASYNSRWRIEKRSLTTGAVIWTQSSNPSTGSDDAYGVAVSSTGVYIVGYDSVPGYTNLQWRIEKRSLTTGSLIWSKTSNPSSSRDFARDVAVDSTGIYIVGSTGDAITIGIFPGWRIEKRQP